MTDQIYQLGQLIGQFLEEFETFLFNFVDGFYILMAGLFICSMIGLIGYLVAKGMKGAFNAT